MSHKEFDHESVRNLLKDLKSNLEGQKLTRNGPLY